MGARPGIPPEGASGKRPARRPRLGHASVYMAVEIGERVGQRQISTTLDTYTHVLVGKEVSDETLSALLLWSRCGLEAPVS
jgi:hypothetical protein